MIQNCMHLICILDFWVAARGPCVYKIIGPIYLELVWTGPSFRSHVSWYILISLSLKFISCSVGFFSPIILCIGHLIDTDGGKVFSVTHIETSSVSTRENCVDPFLLLSTLFLSSSFFFLCPPRPLGNQSASHCGILVFLQNQLKVAFLPRLLHKLYPSICLS